MADYSQVENSKEDISLTLKTPFPFFQDIVDRLESIFSCLYHSEEDL